MPTTIAAHLSRRFVILTVLLTMFTLQSKAEDWPKYRRDLLNTGYSAETGISSATVSSLKLKWRFPAGGRVTGTPAVVTIAGKSMVFFGTWRGVFYALNAVTGTQIWKYSIPALVPTPFCASMPSGCEITSSAAVTNGIVYFGSRSGSLYALNATTGAEVWKVQLGDPTQGYEIWSSPAVYNGMVIVGLASHNDTPCVPGRVEARNATTGASVWSFATLDQTSCPSGVCVGASVWSSAAIDAQYNMVYVSTGNPGSTCSPGTANATRYPDSIPALNASTGQLVNYFQAIPNDNRDLDFGSSPVLQVSGVINQCQGTPTRIRYWVSAGNKNGVMYTLSRGASGLQGPPTATLLDGSGIIASPLLVPHVTTSVCAPGRTRTIYQSDLIVPTTAGNIFDLAQNRNGAISIAQQEAITTSGLLSAPAGITDLIFFGGMNNTIYAMTTSGTIVWQYPTLGFVASGPAISNGRIYVGSVDNNLYAFSLNGQ